METINAQSLDHARQTIINHFLDRKFDVADVTDPWMETAEAYLEEYTGDFTYLVDVQQAYRRRGFLSPAQAKGVLNCLRAQVLREHEQQEPAQPAPSFQRVANGIYTVVLQDGSHVTLRLSDPRFGDFAEGTQVLAYLSGCNNETSFTSFAFVTDAEITVWKKFRGQLARQLHAAEFLHHMERADVLQAGFAYAMASGRCFRCNRTLTVPASIHQGLGPECAKLMRAV